MVKMIKRILLLYGVVVITNVIFISTIFLKMDHCDKRKLFVRGATDEDVSELSDEDAQWMREMEAKYKETKNRIKKVCKEKNFYHQGIDKQSLNDATTTLYFRTQLDPKHKLGYCQQAKAGSSTWMKHFFRLKNPHFVTLPRLMESDMLHDVGFISLEISKQIQDHIWSEILNDGLTASEVINAFIKKEGIFNFSFVRHPFERLVSTYEDKVLGKSDGHNITYLEGYSFPEFADYVIKRHHSLDCDSNMFCELHWKLWTKDIHWTPQYNRCLYCDIEYDVIGKVETFSEDVRYIVKKRNLSEWIPTDAIAEKMHSSEVAKPTAKQQMGSKAAHYFSQLKADQIRHLYHIYEPDFLLFDYSADAYLKIGRV